VWGGLGGGVGGVWGVGVWVRPPHPHPQTPNPQSPIPNPHEFIFLQSLFI